MPLDVMVNKFDAVTKRLGSNLSRDIRIGSVNIIDNMVGELSNS